jgi:O-antigen/teichoic acid export membrane protein
MIAGTLLNNLLMYFFSIKMFPGINCRGKIKREESKKLISNVGSLFGHQLDMVVITSADNIIISMCLGLTTLTIYNNYYFIVNSILSILIIISNSFAASIGNSIAVESREKNYKNFIDFTYLLGMLNVICTILMFVLYQDFMKIWMGDLMLLKTITVFLMCLCFYARQFRRTVITYKTAAGLWKMDMIKPYLAGR